MYSPGIGGDFGMGNPASIEGRSVRRTLHVADPQASERLTGTTRVEAFSDGVFAIALTLLVLDLKVPERADAFPRELREQWPTYLAYLAAFVNIASICRCLGQPPPQPARPPRISMAICDASRFASELARTSASKVPLSRASSSAVRCATSTAS